MNFVKRHALILGFLGGISASAIGTIVASQFALPPLPPVLGKHGNLLLYLAFLFQDLYLLLRWAQLRKVRTTQRNKSQEIVLPFLGGTSVTAIGLIVIVLVASQFVSAPLGSLMVKYTLLVICLANFLLFAALYLLFKDELLRKARKT